ncbi:hypothetical protein THAOC_32535 [Thalassiosira oceanica]|uniref:Uncharacterized protein n=1 Tax=Thalassiosira oceanica TaxID=159749 RepID=K0RIE7_THAOC|nr:hypothetical protein THAOC_32535 [Thalassiosira oceanica]|eukprot:EJK48651.1 hypothetical protein THAOC_32535 [Thalassiosira oceanica]
MHGNLSPRQSRLPNNYQLGCVGTARMVIAEMIFHFREVCSSVATSMRRWSATAIFTRREEAYHRLLETFLALTPVEIVKWSPAGRWCGSDFEKTEALHRAGDSRSKTVNLISLRYPAVSYRFYHLLFQVTLCTILEKGT